jgi:hypothetical protein
MFYAKPKSLILVLLMLMNGKKIFNSFWHMYSWRLFNFNGVLLEIFEKKT